MNARRRTWRRPSSVERTPSHARTAVSISRRAQDASRQTRLSACGTAPPSSLKTFTKAFGHIEFNSRDYYVQGPEAWTEAADARMEINLKIRDIVKYVEDHLESLAEQAPKK
jgi:hypothetical protein